MGMEPHFNLWNYFFHIRLWQSLGMEVAVWGAMWISASGLGRSQLVHLRLHVQLRIHG
jgi:hypothetical protein